MLVLIWSVERGVLYPKLLGINVIFVKNEEAILNGEFHESLFDMSSYEAQIKDIIKISVEKIYQSEEVISKEIAGYRMLSYLLDIYTKAMLPDTDAEDSNFTKLVLKSVPELEPLQNSESTYEKLIGICSYTASLTDGMTVASFKKYKGQSL